MNKSSPEARIISILLALVLTFAPLALYAQDAPVPSEPDASEATAEEAPEPESELAAEETPNPASETATDEPPGPAGELVEKTPENADASGSAAAEAPALASSPESAAGPKLVSPPASVKGPGTVVGPSSNGLENPDAESAATAKEKPVEKPEAAVTLTITAEQFQPEESRAALDWSLRARLDKSYRLMDPKRVGNLEIQAATATEKEDCTSEDCLRALKRRLITDRLFAISIAPDGEFAQVRLTLIRGDEKILRSEVCPACTLDNMRERMLALLDEIIVADLEKPDLDAVAAAVPVPPEEEKKDEDEGFSLPWWVYVAAGVLLLGALGGGGGEDAPPPSEGGGSGSGSVGVTW